MLEQTPTERYWLRQKKKSIDQIRGLSILSTSIESSKRNSKTVDWICPEDLLA
jgi:hypothetical protein